MALAELISKLDDVEPSEKQEHYLNIAQLLSENIDSVYDGVNKELIGNLCNNILVDLKKETELPQLVKLLQSVFQNKHLTKYFTQAEKVEVFKDAVNTIDYNMHEDVLVNYFSALFHIPSFNVENECLSDLLKKMEDVLTKKNEPASTYAVCNYFQKFLKDYEGKLCDFMPLLTKIVFLPLCHPSNKVREVAEKNLDLFPKILLYSSEELATACLLKLLRETYCRDMLQLFKEKQEIYVLKVWMHVVKALGSALSANLSSITPFFQVIEKGFKSQVDEICIASFNAWKCLIDNFAGTEGVLNDSKRLRFILKPFKNIARSNENILSVACDTWMHLAWSLSGYLSSRFTEVCIPLLELTVGKISNGLPEKISQKGPITLVKKSCFILLRFLELPPTEAFNRLNSPKKLPFIPYPALQTPLDIKVITHHFKEIMNALKVIIDVCGTKEDMKLYLDCLMKSVLFVVSTVIEDSNKESTEAVYHFLNFLSDVIESKAYPSLACLKCLESLSKLSRKVLVSHCFSCGSGKPQDILCMSLLKMLLNPHLFPSEAPKRFYAAYNRLIQAGIHESFHPLSNAHKVMHILKSAIGTNSFDVEILIEMWSGVASVLLEVIEKTQEVNQGDKQEHDFSCMYDVLLFPFEFIFPVYIHQFRLRPVIKLWTSMYKAFIRSASLVTSTSVNEACENFCFKLKGFVKEDVLKKPHFFESFCLFMQSIMESVDFISGNSSGTQGFIDVALMIKRKKPLGNLTSFVDLLAILLKAFHACYVEADEDSVQSSAPAIQRKVHIVRNAAPLDILKSFFGSIKSGGIISLSLEQLVDPISKMFMKSSQKGNSVNYSDAKLEVLWNVISSSIERYYLGPYDSEFLALMSPLLEATFSYPKRNLKEKSRRFWFATFGPNASSLKFPDSLKNVLKKMKLPLLPGDVSPVEFSISPMPDSLPEDSTDVNPAAVPTSSITIPPQFKSPAAVNGEVSKVVSKENKQSPKISIDDLPSEEFVKIDSPVVNTPQRRTYRKRRSFVPTLYNDLSQDTATLMSSSESQDTGNSASLDQTQLKEITTETKVTSDKEHAHVPPPSHVDAFSECRKPKSSLSSKFEEHLDQNLKNDLNDNDLICIESSGSEDVTKISKVIIKDTEESSVQNRGENIEKSTVCDKISVFSKPGNKQLTSRSSRRNPRLSQSFSVFSAKKEAEKLEFQKLNKSCVELINLSDSEDIIPSSQGSLETESSSKVTINNENQVLEVTDDTNMIVEKIPEVVSAVEEGSKGIDREDFSPDKLSFKIATSTPLKSKTAPTASDDVCKTHSLAPENELNNASVPPDDEENYVITAEIHACEVTDEEKQKPRLDNLVAFKEPDTESHSKDSIKDLNFLLDAVDNLVSSHATNLNNNTNDEAANQTLQDLETKDVSGSKTEADVAAQSSGQKRTSSPYEPIAKRSRLSLKMSQTGPQNDGYSQKLKKKTSDSALKSQQKPKRKKNSKKTDKVDESAGKANVSDQSILPEKKDVGTNLVCNVGDSEVDKKAELKNESSNSSAEENLPATSQKEEIHHETESQSVESCEIFEAFSNTCEDVQDMDVDIAPIDSNNSDSNSSLSKENKASDFNSQTCELLENQSSVVSNEMNSNSVNNENTSDSKDTLKKSENDNVTVITVIPSSFENDCSSSVSEIIESENVNQNITVDNSHVHPIKSVAGTNDSSIGAKNDELNSDPSSVEFSIIEDNLSCEMHRIVDSVVGVNCESIVKENLTESKSIVSEANSVGSKMGSLACDNDNVTSGVSISELKENSARCIVKEVLSQLSADFSQDGSNSINFSCDVVVSDNILDNVESSAEIMENSDQIDSRKFEDKDFSSDKENIPEMKPCDTAKKSGSENDLNGNAGINENFASELDHSYSISKENPSSSLMSNAAKNKSKNLKTVDLNIKCNENEHLFQGTDTVMIAEKIESPKSFECPSNISLHPFNCENEIKCIIKDLIIKVEKLNVENYYLNTNKSNENTIKVSIENSSLDSSHISNKENEVLASSSDDKFAKGSKKRKIKLPIRSPFNFRQRGKIEPSKKTSTKSVKSLSISQSKTASENKDLVIKALFPKDDLKDDDNDRSMAKIISSIVESITVDDEMNTDMLPCVPSSSHMSKAQRIELSNDELTDLNTRLNAQIAHQTRRIKMMADSQTSAAVENETVHSDDVSMSLENSPTNLSSILKKRKISEQPPPKKLRKVTFASPLIHELVFETGSESRSIETIPMNRLQNLNKKRKKILQEKNKAGKANLTQPSVPSESEEVPSSSEYQDSDVLDFSDLPVSSALINCPDDISNILKDLTSPSWVRGLESLLTSKNIKTIGDVCKLNIHQVKALPFKSPKVVTLHKALLAYVNATQEVTLQKFRTIDDGSFGEMDEPSIPPQSSESLKTENSEECNNSVLTEETVREMLKKDRLRELPMNLLGQLVEACGKVIIEKNQQS